MDTVLPDTLHDRITNGAAPTVIDVRDPADFDTERINPGSGTVHNLPIRQYDDLAALADDAPDADRVYVICWTGVCSQRVAQVLDDAGYTAISVDGGMDQWRNELHDTGDGR